jgi:DNA-binding XRE family transcriptional regulator
MPTKTTMTDDVKARAKALRAKFVHNPSIEDIVTPEELADATPFYFSLRAFVQLLKMARESAGLTLDEVAKRTGLAEETLCRLETGKATNPSYQTLAKFAAAVGMSLRLTAEPNQSS